MQRDKCHHRYPRTIEPWDPDKARCLSCRRPAPEHITKALYNQTLNRRIRRSIRAQWARMEA